MVRTLFIYSFTVVFMVSFPALAQQSLWQKLTGQGGTENNSPDPSETLQAPFAYDPARQVGEVKPLPENAVPLDKPHRTTAEIAQWLTLSISEVMSIAPAALEEELETERIYFSTQGMKQFTAFLESSGIKKVVDNGGHSVRSFVRDTPELLNEGERNGHYRWLFEIPVMVSYVDKNATSYKEVRSVNQAYELILQVGRVADNDANIGGREGVVIEIWRAEAKPLDNR